MKTANSPKRISRNLDNSDDTTTKVFHVFQAFLNGWSGHRFNAERELHDHCLHSTVSIIEKKYQVTIHRKWVTVRGYNNTPTRVKVYWLSRENQFRFLSNLRNGA